MTSYRKLVVKPICGKLIHDTETFGKMDPYCKVIVGNQSYKTKVADGAGKFPNWQDELCFALAGEEKIGIEIWDFDNSVQDDFVGRGSVSVGLVKGQEMWEDWVEILNNGRKAGEVRLKIIVGKAADGPGIGMGFEIGNGLEGFGYGEGRGENDLMPGDGINGFGTGDTHQGYPKSQENTIITKNHPTSSVSPSYCPPLNPAGPTMPPGPSISLNPSIPPG